MIQHIWALQSQSNDPGCPNDEVLIIFVSTSEKKRITTRSPFPRPHRGKQPLRRLSSSSADPLSSCRSTGEAGCAAPHRCSKPPTPPPIPSSSSRAAFDLPILRRRHLEWQPQVSPARVKSTQPPVSPVRQPPIVEEVETTPQSPIPLPVPFPHSSRIPHLRLREEDVTVRGRRTPPPPPHCTREEDAVTSLPPPATPPQPQPPAIARTRAAAAAIA